MPNQYDAIILGAGNAGLAAARVLADADKRIAIVEHREFGGTCPNRGCTPKKVLVAAASALDEIAHAGAHGICTGTPTLDWSRLIERKNDLIRNIPTALESVAQQRGDVYREPAQFVGPNAVLVGNRTLEGDHVIIATGSRPRVPAVAGAEHMATSDDLLSLTKLPRSVVFLGGGVIAFEFAHVLVRAGVRVTILEAMPRVLPAMDKDAIDVLVDATRRLGIDIRTGVSATDIRPGKEGFVVAAAEQELARAELVVNGTGRVPDLDRLNLAAAGVRCSKGAIDVDRYLRACTNRNVWVCGDALAASPQLSPMATHEGTLVARNILEGPVHTPEHDIVPRSVFTIPSLSTVGLTEAQALASHPGARVTVNDMSGWFSARTHAQPVAWAKTVVDGDRDRVLGAHLIGPRGEELIHLFAMAMKHDIPASELARGPFSFPTFSADVKSLL